MPGDFIDIKKKAVACRGCGGSTCGQVDEEQQRIADGTQANKRVTMMVQRKKKPTMEATVSGMGPEAFGASRSCFHRFSARRRAFLCVKELSVKYGMSTARLDFFHDLFESFLPPEEALETT